MEQEALNQIADPSIAFTIAKLAPAFISNAFIAYAPYCLGASIALKGMSIIANKTKTKVDNKIISALLKAIGTVLRFAAMNTMPSQPIPTGDKTKTKPKK
jgi:hypothetical protein